MKVLVTSQLLQKNKICYWVDNNKTKVFTDEPTITDIRSINWFHNHWRKRFRDEPTITEIRIIIESTINRQNFTERSDITEPSITKRKNYTDELSISEIRNITDSTITGDEIFSDGRTITEQRNITHLTIISQKC